jgi:hypothetical protein
MHPNLMEMRMFGTVATIKIKEGKGAEFEKIATELVNKVNENEKGCLLYQVYHDRIPDARDFVLAVHDSVLDPDRGCGRTRLQPGFDVSPIQLASSTLPVLSGRASSCFR